LPKPLNSDEEGDEFVFGRNFFESFCIFKKQLNRWLSLHTNSPTFAVSRC